MGRIREIKRGAPIKVDQRAKILRSLAKGRKTRKMLVKLTGIEENQMLRVLRRLEGRRLIGITKKKGKLKKVDGRAHIYRLMRKDQNAIQEINEITGLTLKRKYPTTNHKYKIEMFKLLLSTPQTQKELLKKTGLSSTTYFRHFLNKFKEKGLIIQGKRQGKRQGGLIHINPSRRYELLEKYPELKFKPVEVEEKKTPIREPVKEKPRKLNAQEQTFAKMMAAIKKKSDAKKK